MLTYINNGRPPRGFATSSALLKRTFCFTNINKGTFYSVNSIRRLAVKIFTIQGPIQFIIDYIETISLKPVLTVILGVYNLSYTTFVICSFICPHDKTDSNSHELFIKQNETLLRMNTDLSTLTNQKRRMIYDIYFRYNLMTQ